MWRTRVGLTVALLVLMPAAGLAQGVLVVVDPDHVVRLPRPVIIYPPHPHPWPRPIPEPPATYQVKEVEIQARLVDQVAQVQVAQTFENTGSRQLEVSFIFPLPYDGAIESMTLLVDGKEFPAKLLDAQEARRLYEAIVRKNKDPALLEWMGTGLFKTSVFPVPPGAKRTVSLRYAQLCRQEAGLTDFLFPLSTAKYTSKPCEKLTIRVTVETSEPLKNLYSPTHAIEIKRSDERHAVVSYQSKNEVPANDFRLFYDIGKGKVSTRVLSYRPEKEDEGFFLLLASPEIKPSAERLAKTVLFVIDRSGSMAGKKIEQVRAALKDVLNKLRPGDLFNIVAYDSQVEAFRPELQKYEDATRKAALGFVEGLYAGGSTNIDGALKTALGQLQDSQRPAYVVFLTDGLPTAGETNEAKIAANAKDYNKVRARVFSFGVGYDVNARLLDKLVRDNFGQSDYVRPDEDIEQHIARLYNRIESPVLTDVNLDIAVDAKPEEGRLINRVYPKGSFDLFAGEQLVVVGRYKKPGTAKVTIRGRVGPQEQKFDFPATLVDRSKDDSSAFIEKLWAVRRVGEILDELDLKGKNEELVKELVGLATRHGILTPYTSFMADDSVNVRDLAMSVTLAEGRLRALERVDGVAGVEQRQWRANLSRAAAAPPAAEAAKALHDFSGRQGGGMGAGPALEFAEDARKEAAAAERNVRVIGSRTFFRRNAQWVDSQVTKDQEAKATRVKQFSDEYFALARRHGRTLAQYLVFDEPVLLTIADQTYLIEP